MPITRLALLVSAALAAPCALAALDNYTIDLRRESSGLNIVASATPGPVAAVQVTNRSSSRARCFVDFEGGRLTPTRREAWLDSGTTATVQQRINDPDITSLTVGVSCDTLSADAPIPPASAPGSAIVRGTNDTGTPAPPAPGSGGTPTPPPPSGTSVRNTNTNATRTDVTGTARSTRQTGTATVISPSPGSTPAPGTTNRATQ